MELLTPAGIAGIAVVRAERHERAVLAGMLRTPGGGAFVSRPGDPPRRGVLWCEGSAIDDVLVVDRDHGLEVHLHGSHAVLSQLARSAGLDQAAPASPAERLLREAMSRAQLDLALEQMTIDFAAFCRDLAALGPESRAERGAAASVRSRVALAHAVAQRIVLVGAQNAGKSSLFNRLLFRERVLTGPLPGLTRDPVAEVTVLDGYPYEVVDTAGEGPAATPEDAAAIGLGREQRRGALLVLLVDAAGGPSVHDRTLARDASLVIANKADLSPAPWPADMPRHASISCLADDPVHCRDLVGGLLRRHRGLPPAGPVGGAAALDAAQLALLEAAARGER